MNEGANYTYMASIAPKTWIDAILLTIWKGGLNGKNAVSLESFVYGHSTQIMMCVKSGYIKHQGDGFYFMTRVGQSRLESSYKKLPSNHTFKIEEVCS